MDPDASKSYNEMASNHQADTANVSPFTPEPVMDISSASIEQFIPDMGLPPQIDLND